MASRAAAMLSPAHYPARLAPASRAPALTWFDAATFSAALPKARATYAKAACCLRCRQLLAHRFDRLGSTLFRDDNTRALLEAFDTADRDQCSERLLAACIVLFGRDRVGLN